MLALLFALVPLASSQILIGGPMQVDVHRDDVQKMASFAVDKISELTSSKNSLVKILDAHTQVVSGVNYLLSLQVQDGSNYKICNITVWSRPWMNEKRVTKHMCSPPMHSVRMAGGFHKVDVHSASVVNAAAFAIGELNRLTQTKNIIEEVESAYEQVVAGMKFNLTVRISDNQSNVQRCNVTVFIQSWTATREMTYKNCRSSPHRRQLLGGLNAVNPHSADIQKMAAFALSEINGLEGAKNTLEEVTSAKTQVVSGMNYYLTIKLNNGGKAQECDVTIWSQPWTNTLKMTSQKCKTVQKRDLLLGGHHHIAVTDPKVQKLASFAVSEINGLDSQQNSLVKVVSATEQVVAGLSYHLVLSLQNGGQTQLCDVEIWTQSWSNKQTMTKHKCRVASSKRDVLGLLQPVDLSPAIQEVISFAEDSINAQSNSMYRMVTATVSDLKRQIVAGAKYTFELHLVTSSCMNDDSSKGKNLELCPENSTIDQHQTCDVSVLAQIWMDPKYTLLKHDCSAFIW